MKFLPNTVINFHAIHDPEWMDSVLSLLKKCYHVIPIHELERFYFGSHPLKNTCHLTFDDGDATFYRNAIPLLKKHNVSASIYVSPKAIREGGNFWFQEIRGYDEHKLVAITCKRSKNLNISQDIANKAIFKSLPLDMIWDIIEEYRQETGTPPKPATNMSTEHLREVQNSGLVAIGAHTQNHPILSNENDQTAEQEILGSITELADLLSSEVRYFAYPNGRPGADFGQREMDILSKAGIKIAFSTEKKRFSHKDNPLAVPRNGLTYGNNAFVLAKLMAGSKWDLLKKMKTPLKTR